MLRQTFTSEPFLYRLPADIPPAFPDTYYPAFITPPRIYGEEYDGGGVVALFLNQEESVDGYEVIYLWLIQNQIYWPSYNFGVHRWNATTGAYLGYVSTGFADADLHIFAQSRDGTLWSLLNSTSLQAFKYSVDPVTHALSTDGVVQYDFSGFAGIIIMTAFCIDPQTNTLLAGINVDEFLRVYDLTTGALIRSIGLPGLCDQIMPEDGNRCYVMTSAGVLCLVDFVAGKVLTAFRVQTTFSPYSPQKSITWDRKYRRFLSWVYTPVDVTGQNTSVIKGYFPQPQPVGITKPIPLRPPRKYRSTPILTRIYGDLGEPMPGARVTLSPDSGVGVVTGFPALTDSDGESVGTVYDADAGALTLTASSTV